MKIFISWSGSLSRQLGEAIRDWLPGVLQSTVPYFTPSDIEKGNRWSTDIAKELESSQIGILCVTRDNLHSDWILFEAGALSKSMDKSHVCPILFGITNTDLAGPLKQFQTTEFEKSDFQKLIGVINSRLGDLKLNSKTLDIVFDKWWPDLERKITEIMASTVESKAPLRSDRELIEEILLISRESSRRASRPSIAADVILELLEAHIILHDDQASEGGGYTETLHIMKKYEKPLDHIARKYKGTSEEFDKKYAEFISLSYEVYGRKNKEFDDSNDPF